jgi:hypothetical protein
MTMIRIRCKDHPLYRAKRTPRVLCNACWYIFHIKTHIEQTSDERLQLVRGLEIARGDANG